MTDEAGAPDAAGGARAPGGGRGAILSIAGLVFVALGLMLAAAWLAGAVTAALFPTGWVMPAILVLSGALMALRRRFDIVATLWAATALVVFMLDMEVYARTLDQGFEDPGAFDATLIVGGLGLVPLVLRPLFRD